MMKWLRAHSKQIMVIVVLLAMFSFVGGSALVSFLAPNPAKEVVIRAFDMDVTQGELSFARRDIEVLENLFSTPAQYKAQYGEFWQFGNRKLKPEHWYLLAREAEVGGVAVSDQEIDQQLEMLPTGMIDVLRTTKRITPPELRQALRRHMSIQKNANHIVQSAMPSEAEVKHFVLDTEDKMRVKLAAISAERFSEKETPLSEDEVRAHFAKYKDVDPAESEDGFGYKHQRRVKLQYIVANLTEIAPQVQVSMDAIKAYWKANKAGYKKTIYVDAEPTSQTTTSTSQPASAPAPQPKMVEKTFSEAQADVEREIRQKNALQAAEHAAKKALALLLKPWQEVKTDPVTHYKPIPPGVETPDFMREICDRVSREFNTKLQYVETGLLSQSDMMAEPNLRGAMLPGAGPEAGLAIIAFQIAPFHKERTEDDAGIWLQLFQPPDAPFIGQSPQFVGGRFEYAVQRIIIFRVVEAREAEAPVDVAEVRDKVERDLRILKGYQKAEPVARELYAIAARLGLEKALDLMPALKAGPGAVMATTPPAFARRARLGENKIREALEAGKPPLGAPSVVGVGESEVFVDACFEMAKPGWMAPQMDIPETEQTAAATTQPALEPAPVVRLISLPKLRKHFVVEVAGMEPVDEEKFASELRQSGYYRLLSDRGSLLRTKWYDIAEIEKRVRMERVSDPAEGGLEGIMPPQPLQPPQF